jgi:hypothetical protein
VKAEAAKCVLCIPDAGPRAQEFGPSSAQENARQKKVTYATQRELAKRCVVALNCSTLVEEHDGWCEAE